MSEWDFLWDLSGQKLEYAMSSGETADDWGCIKGTFKRNKLISDSINDGINSTKEMLLKEIKNKLQTTVAQLSDFAGITKRNIQKI